MKPSPFAISRRRFLASTAALATTLQLQRAARAAGLMADAQVCTLAAEQEVGPYYVANELIRSDISEHKPGIPLSLRILVLDARTCKPISNAAVDVWHCDALGLYAGFTQQNPMGPGGPGGPDGPARFGGPPPGGSPPGFDPQHPGNRPGPPENMGPPPRNHPSDNFTFLRGIQLTGADGAVSFRTVFPGFYMGRTNHIHFKVRIGGHATAMRALRHGVPIVAIPGLAGDQPDVAVAIRRTIRRVLAAASYAATAKESAAWPASTARRTPWSKRSGRFPTAGVRRAAA